MFWPLENQTPPGYPGILIGLEGRLDAKILAGFSDLCSLTQAPELTPLSLSSSVHFHQSKAMSLYSLKLAVCLLCHGFLLKGGGEEAGEKEKKKLRRGKKSPFKPRPIQEFS